MARDPSRLVRIGEAEDLDTRWPKDGDRLFVEFAWAYDAHILRDKGERFYRLPKGYKRAGDILVEQAATDVADRANVIYAALFCYRQAIELFLKHLIDEFGKGRVYSPKHTHELNHLWERFICIANERSRGESLGLNAVQSLVAEMHQADQKSRLSQSSTRTVRACERSTCSPCTDAGARQRHCVRTPARVSCLSRASGSTPHPS